VAPELPWINQYRGLKVILATGTSLRISDIDLRRAAVKYGRAINHAVALSEHISAVHTNLGRDFEIELSIDETPQPTTLAEHWIIADQCLRRGMKLVSLAPRFIGDFEKGVDYKGDPDRFETSLADHAAIASEVGPYKLSLHSGSDKLSIYGTFARFTRGLFHVKTAGTSYVEALRVAARHAPAFFRRIVAFCRDRYHTDKATYHVSATLDGVPAESDLPDDRQLEKAYLGDWEDVPPGLGFSNPGRQIVHCTFGSVLTHPRLKPELRQVLVEHQSTYEHLLADHFSRHLKALRGGM
jgi:tagaturonate epimerase